MHMQKLLFLKNINVFLNGVQLAISQNPALGENFEVDFYGPCCEKVSEIVKQEKYNDLDDIIVCKGSVSHEEAITHICNADILYLISHAAKGIATGKIYEFFAAQKTILSVPGDNDITDRMIKSCNVGFVASDEDAVANKLLEFFEQWLNCGKLNYNADYNEVNKFNRKIQTGQLAKILDGVSR